MLSVAGSARGQSVDDTRRHLEGQSFGGSSSRSSEKMRAVQDIKEAWKLQRRGHEERDYGGQGGFVVFDFATGGLVWR